MRQSLRLRTEPDIRQTRAIIDAIERELAARGAVVSRERNGAVCFRMPAPWRAVRLGPDLAVTSGRVMITAAGGGPWRLRYELSFRWLRVLTLVASIAVVVVGWSWPRLTLLNALVILWAVVFGVLYVTGAMAVQRLIAGAAADVVERRRVPRATDITPGT